MKIREEDKTEEARMLRFQKELSACNVLIDCENEVLDKYEGRIKLRGSTAEQDLDLIVSAMYGKAGKTFQAVIKLGCAGFGEDALIVLRSNINLMVNLFYILAENSIERAGDLIAYSHREQAKYLEHGHKSHPEWIKELNWDEINPRAERWDSVGIKKRAKKAAQQFHYDVGYRFYSSIEHSDAWALSHYVSEWNERGPKISSEPSDDYIDIALVHNFWVMANVFFGFCRHFSIEEPGVTQKLDAAWKEIGGRSITQKQ